MEAFASKGRLSFATSREMSSIWGIDKCFPFVDVVIARKNHFAMDPIVMQNSNLK